MMCALRPGRMPRERRAGGARIVESLDALRSRFLYKTLDATVTAHFGAPRPAGTLAAAVRADTSSYERVRSIVQLLGGVLPDPGRMVRRLLLRPRHLPFAGRLEPLSFGSGSTVFLLRGAAPGSEGRDHVLKVYRRSLGRRLEALQSLAEEFRAKYRTVGGWYEGTEVVLPTSFLILHGPILGQPAVACVQPYLTGEKRDFFADFSDEEILALIRANPGLHDQFGRFAERTLRVLREENRCADLVGDGNLLLLGTPRAPRLCLIDFGIFDLAERERNAPKAARRIRARLEWLERLHESVKAES